ncbi:MAG: hypothetical protein AAF799_22130 [Myxococcota bacterium]
MSHRSPLLEALTEVGGEAPASFSRFDALVRGDGPPPSFEEYSAWMGGELRPWRETCYFDATPSGEMISLANTRFESIVAALGVSIPKEFWRVLSEGGAHAPAVRQVVLGIEAEPSLRLKYYLVFRGPAAQTVEAFRAAVGAPELPPSLDTSSMCILGLDFNASGLHDFKVYVRLDAKRLPRVIGNFTAFRTLVLGCRYLVFQQCVHSQRRQVYFHSASAELLEGRLPLDPKLRAMMTTMNERLDAAGAGILRPWIASYVYERRALHPTPANVYFHYLRK